MNIDIKDMLPIDIQLDYIPVYHSNSNVHGVGVFTPMDISKEGFVGVGHVFYKGFWYMTTHGYYNHSESSNCIIETRDNINLIIAKVDIIRGEELTADYRDQPYLEQPKDDWK